MRQKRNSDVTHNPKTPQDKYVRRGYRSRWIDTRVGSIGTRRELAREWHQRGASDSDHFRALTNALIRGLFGVDVEQLRQIKGISIEHGSIRDQLSDLDLALLTLAETTAIELSRARGSSTLDALLADVAEAGKIVADTRRKIDAARLRSAG